MAGPAAERVYHGKHSYPCRSDAAIDDMDSTDFHGLVIPGGFMPDKLRRDAQVLKLVREFAQAGKLVAAICHAGWIPISAGVYRGVQSPGRWESRTIWSTPGPVGKTRRWSSTGISSAAANRTTCPTSTRNYRRA